MATKAVMIAFLIVAAVRVGLNVAGYSDDAQPQPVAVTQ